jgi:membrane fusion protein, multidrug efflux system
MEKTRASSWFVRLAIAIAVIGGLIWYLRRDHATAATHGGAAPSGDHAKGKGGGRVVPVQVAIAKHEDYLDWRDGLGTAAAQFQVTVHTLVDGRLDQVFFKEGQPVKKGDMLAQVDPRPYMVQLHNAEGALARDVAQLKAAQADLDRQKAMRAQNLVAQATVDASAGTEGNFEGAVKVDQAAIESARLNLDYAAIRSPIDGIAGVRLVDAGNLVHAADAGGIVVIAAVDPAAVYITMPQDELDGVAQALAAGTARVEVWDAHADMDSVAGRTKSKKLAEGTQAILDNQVNAATANIRLKAILPNPDHALWPSEFVKARVLVRTITNAITVPAAAVQQGPSGAYVYVVGADNAVTMTPVKVELTHGDTSVIANGLSGGEHVVTEGGSQLRDGGKVSIGDDHAKPDAAGAKPDAAGSAANAAGSAANAPGSAAGSAAAAGAMMKVHDKAL